MIKYFYTQIVKKAAAIEILNRPQLTADEIINFDTFYNNIVRSQIVRENGRKKMIQQIYTPNIAEVLHQKIGDDTVQINTFLQLRKNNLRQEEVVYCLDALIKNKQFATLEQSDILPHIDSLILDKTIQFNKAECLQQIYLINRHLQFLSLDSLKLLAKQLNEAGQFIEKEVNEENIEQLALAFILACEIDYNNVVTQAHLIHVRKIIKRHFKLLKFETIIRYFITIIKYQTKLQTELDQILDIEEFFGDNHNVLTLENYITIIEYLGLIKFKKRSEVVIQFTINIEQFKLNITQLAILAKSFAVMEIKIKEVWDRIRQDYLELIQKIDTHEFLGEITLIFQSLLQINPLPMTDLQIILSKISKIPIDQCYTIKFQILYNFSLAGHFNDTLFKEICDYERRNFQFKYLNTYKQDKLIELIKVILFNALQYKEKSESIDKALQILMHKMYEVLSNPKYTIKNNFKTYYDLFMISELFTKVVNSWDKLQNIKLEAERKLDRKIQKNQIKTTDAIKLLGLIDYYKLEFKGYNTLIKLVESKLIEFENDLDQLNQLLHYNRIQNSQIMGQFAKIVLEKHKDLTVEQVSKYSQTLRRSGNGSGALELLLISQQVNVLLDNVNYEVEFLFN